MEGAMMKLNWTQRAGALAMTAAMSSAVLGLGLAGPADAKGKSGVLKPNEPTAVTTTERGKSGVLKPNEPTAVATTERGIKDNGVKGCTGCGLTGRAAAPPPPASGETTDSIYGPGVSPEVVQDQPAASGTGRNKSGTLPPPEPSAEKGKTGWIIVTPEPPMATDKPGRPKVRDKPYSTSSRSVPPSGTPHSTAKGGKTGWLLGIGGLAAIAAVVAVSSGSGTPASP
jgi:hypothetical protein